MAAPENVNHDQFEDHVAMLSSVESTHDIEIDPMMGVRQGGGQPFLLADLMLFGRPGSGSTFPTNSARFSGRIPHEDPERVDRVDFYSPVDLEKGNRGPVGTHESHGYPIPDSVSERNPKGKVNRFHRYTNHPDLDSAVAHLKSAGEERQGHLEAGTMPEPISHGNSSYQAESTNVFPLSTDRATRPPSTIKYHQSRAPLGSKPGIIDTGTRQLIPEEDE